MKQMVKRGLALLMVLVMCFGLIPVLGGHAHAESGKVWKLVTDASALSVGDQIVIVAKDSDYALSTTQNSNYRGQAAVTKGSDTVAFGSDVQVITLESGTKDGTFAFNVGNGYLCAASSNSNHLKTETTRSDNSSWKISIANGVASVIAQGTYTKNTLQYNKQSTRFSCYGGATQQSIAIYKQTESTCQHVNMSSVVTDPTCEAGGYTTDSCECGYTKVHDTRPALGHSYGDDDTCDVCGAVQYTAKLVTNVSQLSVGNKVIIVAKDYDRALGTFQDTSNRKTAEITKGDSLVTFVSTAGVQIITLESGTKDGTFAFNVGGGYLCAASSTSNHLKTENTLSDNSSWSISIEDGTASVIAQGTNTKNTMQYNDGSTLFSCYGGATQAAIVIYEIGGDEDDGSGETGGEGGGETECTHSYTSSVTTEATCTEAGVKTYTCGLCPDSYTETIPATGHTYVDGTCTSCGAEEASIITASVSIADYAKKYSWVNGTAYLTVNVDGNVTVTASSGTNNGKYYTSNDSWRIYKSENGTIEVSADGNKIVSVKITYDSSKGTLTYNGANVQSDTDVTIDGVSAAFSASSSIPHITAIEVVYIGVICEHSNTTVVPAVSPKCTENGWTAGSKCADCDYILVVQTKVPATGHNYVDGFCSNPDCGKAKPDGSNIDYVYSTDGNEYIYNWGTREEEATFLSPNAEAFYTGQNTYEYLSKLTGGNGASDAPSSALYGALQTLMVNAHTTKTTYDGTRDLYQYTDCEESNMTTLSCFYTGNDYGSAWPTGGNPWNREHVWPKSKSLDGKSGQDTDDDDEADIVYLRATQSTANSTRNDSAYGVTTGNGYFNPNHYYTDGTYDIRGDAARTILYGYVRWGNTTYMWGADGVMESLDILLKWIKEDPVDTWELGRNDSVESITGTRNVFVDYPELAFLLFGAEIPNDMTTPSGEAKNTINCQHNYVAGTPVASTCTAKGYTLYTCTICQRFYKGDLKDMIPHNYVDGKCTACGDVKSTYGVIEAPVAGTAYKFGMIQKNVSDTDVYYLAGGMDGYYMATTKDKAAAIDVYLEETSGGYFIYIMTNGTKTYINMVDNGEHVNGAYEAAASTVYTFDTASKTVIAQVNGTPYWFGTRNDKTYTTAGPCATSYKGFYCQFYGQPCDHEHVETLSARDATCKVPGLTEGSKCSDCGAILVAQNEIPTVAHTYVAGNPVPPTCVAEGYTPYTCSVCDDSYNGDKLPTVEHTHVAGNPVPPTCAAEGYTPYICNVCGNSYNGDKVAALGHSYVAGTPVPPTCTAEGYTPYICSVCDDSYNGDKVPVIEHNYEDGKCTECGADEHKWIAATCTKPKTCADCGLTEGEALGHSYKLCGYTQPTCTEDGAVIYACVACNDRQVGVVRATGHKLVDGICSICGKVFAEDGSSVTVTDEAVEVVLSDKALSAEDGVVALPIPEITVSSSETAPTITIDVSNGKTDAAVKVEIPVAEVTENTVVVIVHEDGTEEVLKKTGITENGLAFEVEDKVTVKVVDNTKEFEDVNAGDWSSKAIDFASSREILGGVSETKYAPKNSVTCLQLTTLLFSMDNNSSGLSDDEVQVKATEWAETNHIIDSAFNGEETMTREQLAVFIYRYAGAPKVENSDRFDGFADSNIVSSWARDAMIWAVEVGVINGMGDNTLNSTGKATREQVAQVLMNYINKQ